MALKALPTQLGVALELAVAALPRYVQPAGLSTERANAARFSLVGTTQTTLSLSAALDLLQRAGFPCDALESVAAEQRGADCCAMAAVSASMSGAAIRARVTARVPQLQGLTAGKAAGLGFLPKADRAAVRSEPEERRGAAAAVVVRQSHVDEALKKVARTKKEGMAELGFDVAHSDLMKIGGWGTVPQLKGLTQDEFADFMRHGECSGRGRETARESARESAQRHSTMRVDEALPRPPTPSRCAVNAASSRQGNDVSALSKLKEMHAMAGYSCSRIAGEALRLRDRLPKGEEGRLLDSACLVGPIDGVLTAVSIGFSAGQMMLSVPKAGGGRDQLPFNRVVTRMGGDARLWTGPLGAGEFVFLLKYYGILARAYDAFKSKSKTDTWDENSLAFASFLTFFCGAAFERGSPGRSSMTMPEAYAVLAARVDAEGSARHPGVESPVMAAIRAHRALVLGSTTAFRSDERKLRFNRVPGAAGSGGGGGGGGHGSSSARPVASDDDVLDGDDDIMMGGVAEGGGPCGLGEAGPACGAAPAAAEAMRGAAGGAAAAAPPVPFSSPGDIICSLAACTAAIYAVGLRGGPSSVTISQPQQRLLPQAAAAAAALPAALFVSVGVASWRPGSLDCTHSRLRAETASRRHGQTAAPRSAPR